MKAKTSILLLMRDRSAISSVHQGGRYLRSSNWRPGMEQAHTAMNPLWFLKFFFHQILLQRYAPVRAFRCLNWHQLYACDHFDILHLSHMCLPPHGKPQWQLQNVYFNYWTASRINYSLLYSIFFSSWGTYYEHIPHHPATPKHPVTPPHQLEWAVWEWARLEMRGGNN